MSANAPEPKPKANDSAPIWPMVVEDVRGLLTREEDVRAALIADMMERDAMGRVKYGTPLQARNGRNPLVDAYQEALDLCVYLKQALEENRGPLASMYEMAIKVAYRLKYDAMLQEGWLP